MRETEGEFIDGAFDYLHMMAAGEIDLATNIDKIMPNYAQLNLSYLPSPTSIGYPSLIYHPRLKKWQGSLIIPFRWILWVALFSSYLVAGMVVVYVLSNERRLSSIYKLSFEQRNYRFWKTPTQKMFIVFWAAGTAMLTKFYRSQLLLNLVPVWNPIIPYRTMHSLYSQLPHHNPYNYKFVIGEEEDDEYFFEPSNNTISKLFADLISLDNMNVKRVPSSQKYVAENEGSIALTYDYLARELRTRDAHLCYYELLDSPYDIFSIPYHKKFKYRRQLLKAGYAESRFGMQAEIRRKYFSSRDDREGCTMHVHGSVGTHAMVGLSLEVLIPAAKVISFGYVTAFVAFAFEKLLLASLVH